MLFLFFELWLLTTPFVSSNFSCTMLPGSIFRISIVFYLPEFGSQVGVTCYSPIYWFIVSSLFSSWVLCIKSNNQYTLYINNNNQSINILIHRDKLTSCSSRWYYPSIILVKLMFVIVKWLDYVGTLMNRLHRHKLLCWFSRCKLSF